MTLGGRKFPTDVVHVGKPRLLAIGDPSENQISYSIDGAGQWDMGTQIYSYTECKPNQNPYPKLIGTSGALVLRTRRAPLMLSCTHCFPEVRWDIAQAWDDRVPNCTGKKKLKNFVGGVVRIIDPAVADAGVVECSRARWASEPTINLKSRCQAWRCKSLVNHRYHFWQNS
jgi:hypothetical protein